MLEYVFQIPIAFFMCLHEWHKWWILFSFSLSSSQIHTAKAYEALWWKTDNEPVYNKYYLALTNVLRILKNEYPSHRHLPVLLSLLLQQIGSYEALSMPFDLLYGAIM
jgi:hypothetical protein